jgi:hypothetical protein
VLPLFLVSVFHLGLDEASKRAVRGPPGAVTLRDSDLYHRIFSRQVVHINPNSFVQYFLANFARCFVSLDFRAMNGAPEQLAAPWLMLGQGPGTHGDLGRIFTGLTLLVNLSEPLSQLVPQRQKGKRASFCFSVAPPQTA